MSYKSNVSIALRKQDFDRTLKKMVTTGKKGEHYESQV